MANWIIKQEKQGRFELYWREKSRDKSLVKCTQAPQDIDIIHKWLLEPTQAGFCDTVQYPGGVRFAVMAPAES